MNKNFSLNLDFGILGKDYYTPNRSILLYRIIKNNNGFASPYYYQKSAKCNTLVKYGYQAQIEGFKFAINYFIDNIINHRNFKAF